MHPTYEMHMPDGPLAGPFRISRKSAEADAVQAARICVRPSQTDFDIEPQSHIAVYRHDTQGGEPVLLVSRTATEWLETAG